MPPLAGIGQHLGNFWVVFGQRLGHFWAPSPVRNGCTTPSVVQGTSEETMLNETVMSEDRVGAGLWEGGGLTGGPRRRPGPLQTALLEAPVVGNLKMVPAAMSSRASTSTATTEKTYLRRALAEAQAAFEAGEVPVGAVVVHKGQLIGRGHNQREALHDPTAHAEMLALTAAANHLEDWRLAGCTLYVTKEPCAMCAGAMVNARLTRLVFGAWDEEAGAAGSLYQLCRDPRFNHQMQVNGGVLEAECRGLLQEFFAQRREKKG